MRLIDADMLKKCVLKWLPQDPCGKEEKEKPFETDICVSMLMEIDEQPTIQPKRGRWIYHPEWEDDGECGYECSECHMGSDVDYNFCMRCGADMREETT